MLKPGTSCLFMIVEKITPDKAIAALSKYGGTVRKTSLSEEDTNKLPARSCLILAQLLVGAPHPNQHRLRR